MEEIKVGTNKFFIGENEENPKAELTYLLQDETTLVANHTFVLEELRGKGVAGRLFNRFIQFARENNYKIIPECPYIRMKMEETSEFDDVLAK